MFFFGLHTCKFKSKHLVRHFFGGRFFREREKVFFIYSGPNWLIHMTCPSDGFVNILTLWIYKIEWCYLHSQYIRIYKFKKIRRFLVSKFVKLSNELIKKISSIICGIFNPPGKADIVYVFIHKYIQIKKNIFSFNQIHL